MKQVLFALFAATVLMACEHKEQAVENKGPIVSDTMMRMIETDSVRECNITDELTLGGEVSFNENSVVKIFPRSSGQIIEVKVSVGDKVHKGQPLAVIKSADVAGNYSDLSSANADIAIAKRQMDNAESLYKNGISSEKEFNEAKQNYLKAVANRNKIQSLININSGGSGSEGGQYTLVAPIDGYIVEKKATAGLFIRPDMGDNLFTISDLKSVWVYANVYEVDIQNVHEGYAAKVVPVAYPDKIFTGKIDKVSQVLDPQSKSMHVRIGLDNKDLLLKPEMFTKVFISNEQGRKAVCVVSSAIVSQDGKNYVVIFNNRNDVKIAEVSIIKTVGDKTYVRSGITPGQVVVTKHQLFLFNQLVNE